LLVVFAEVEMNLNTRQLEGIAKEKAAGVYWVYWVCETSRPGLSSLPTWALLPPLSLVVIGFSPNLAF
jgi:hypothetical protein